MAPSKTEKKKGEDKTADAKAGKKKRIRKLVWLAVDLAIAAVILGLLLYKPGRYNPLEAVNSKNEEQVFYAALLLDGFKDRVDECWRAPIQIIDNNNHCLSYARIYLPG